MEFGTLSDLLARLKASMPSSGDRPLALLAGSGLTVGAVPGVTDIVRSIRGALPEDDINTFDVTLDASAEPGDKYQAAFKFLGLRRPPSYRDRIIQVAVLAAYNNSAIGSIGDLQPSRLMEYEADADNWTLPAGVEALGRLWVGLPLKVRGPIITTNFDPLIEIAIKKSGGAASNRIMDADGAFLRDVRASEFPQVVHIHGFWRDSSTLSMTAQLTLERPALNGSLRSLLSEYTLLVMGYGGWHDALMAQLHLILAEQTARELDVLWCHYGDENDLHQQLRINPTLHQLLRAPGNIQFYTGIDANVALPAIESALAPHLTYADTERVAVGRGSLLGWDPVPLGTDQDETERRLSAVSFFDGRLPNWADANSDLIPHRDIVTTIRNELRANIRDKQPSLTIISGPSGEGKTTAIMQAATSLADTQSDLVVLFNGDGRVSSVEEILALPAATPHLLVLDDAFRSIDRLRDLAAQLNKAVSRNIHLLVASRDTDWSGAGGFTFAWNRYLRTKVHRLRGISRPDASSIVTAWEKLGPDALGELGRIATSDARINALMSAASDSQIAEEGALLGALLTIRYGDGLVEHIRELALRLADRPIHSLSGTSEFTLADAFFMIAVPHSVQVRTMTASVLARALDLTEHEVHGSVLLPLGEEAAISVTSRQILIRHALIARTACNIAPDLGIDLSKITTRVVQAAVGLIESGNNAAPELRAIAYLSQRLQGADLRVAAATAAIEASPNRISYRTSLSRAYREADDPERAASISEGSTRILYTALDTATGIRPMFTEWGVAEGILQRYARNTVLAGVALQDLTSGEALRQDHACTAIVCLALGLRRLWDSTRKFVYLAGLAALCKLAEGIDMSIKQRRWVEEARVLAFTNGAPAFEGLDAAAKQLAQTCYAAQQALEEPLPNSVPALTFRFTELVRLGEGRGWSSGAA
ncbi:SIR2 family protein [Kribbella sp. NPDC003557]|uniref:P-loop NTPase n=1 Tax=Kribbella sp. NPDC003557 TaxID=3154449 RepID=UPI0033A34458